MKAAAKIVFLISSILMITSLLGCRTTREIPIETRTDSIVVEKLIPVVNPADSATIRALMECDENGQVVLRWYDSEVSENAMLRFQIDSLGRLLANFNTRADTVYIKGKDIYVDRKVEVPVYIEKELTWWERLKMEAGGYAMVGAMIFLIIGIYNFKKRIGG